MNAKAKSSLVGACVLLSAQIMAATPANTPDKFLRYVESTGSQYVDTGIVGRSGTKAESKVEWMDFSDSAFLACGDNAGNTRFYACYCSTASGNMFTALRTGAKVNYNGHDLLFVKKRIYTYTSEFSPSYSNNTSTNTVTIDGKKVFTFGNTSLDTGSNLYIFARNKKGTADCFSKTRCYGLKIWQDGTLVRDFRPCMKNKKAGLYDAVSETIFYSGSGTDLAYDANYDVPDVYIDYVESLGNSYIDTGIVGRYGTKAECKVEWMDFSDSAFLACGDWEQSTRFFACYCRNTSGTMFAAQGTGDNVQSGGKDLAFVKNRVYTYTSDFSNIDGNGNSVNTVSIDGSTVWSKTKTGINTGKNLYIFACNQKANTVIGYSKTRCYGLKIWQNNALVRDYRPCLKYGVAALYDAVSKSIFYPEGDSLAFDSTVTVNKEDLLFVDYIESDGFTHLDTQVKAEAPVRAKGEFSWTELRTSDQEQNIFGSDHRSYLACGYYNSGSDANRFYMVDETAQKPWIGYGNNSQSFGSKMTVGQKYSFDVSFAAGAQTASITPEGGSTVSHNANWSGSATGKGNLYLFACNDAKNGKPIYQSAARCYGLKLYKGSSLVRDFKPCVKDGHAMLYDEVSKKVFLPSPAIPAEGNVGAVAEESGNSPFDTYLEYVETDGTQYIDTGVEGKADTSVEFIETSLCTSSNDEECLIGALGEDANSRFYMWMHGRIWTLGIGYGSSYWRPSMNDPYTPAAQWDASYQDVYRLNNGDRRHAKVTFTGTRQTVTIIGDNGSRNDISVREIVSSVDTKRNLYLFASNNNGTPENYCKSRLEWIKIWQDGHRERHLRPARLKNGLVVMWDVDNNKAYLPKPKPNGGNAFFKAAGPVSDYTRPGLMIMMM